MASPKSGDARKAEIANTTNVEYVQDFGADEKPMIGTVEEGKIADVILVNGDPTTDIACLEDAGNVQVVMKRGTIKRNLTGDEV